MQAGKEATVTIHHEKANSDVTLYVIIPGENSASITLDKNFVSFVEGESPSAVTASIANAEEKDYENLLWTLANANEALPAASLSGSGKTVSVRPLAPGEATLTAKVPSSGKTAQCEIKVEQRKQITFSTSSATIYPGGSVTVGYAVSPSGETANLVWSIGDGSYASFADNHNGSITLIGKDREGSTFLEAASPSGVKARFTVTNKWGDTFAINKTALAGSPVNSAGGAYTVSYNISPACAEIHISTGSGNLRVAENGNKIALVGGEYIVRAANHDSVDKSTGVASGSFSFVPNGEINKTVMAVAHNPQKTKRQDGSFEGADFASKSISVKIGYDSYTFSPYVSSKDGSYSRYDPAIGAFVLGDGERVTFTLPVTQRLATPGPMTVSFEPNNANDQSEKNKDAQNTEDADKRFQREYVYNNQSGTSSSPFVIQNVNGGYTIYHTRDYGPPTGKYFGVDNNAASVEQYNTAVRAVPFVGVIKITYTTGVGVTKPYEIPLYVEVRNCPR